ncbi:MAG: hypothetical protein Alpg2KO_06880 [Alphaproteobacteria bacterium]
MKIETCVMADTPSKQSKAQPDRKDRLAQALRDNLKRRKQQARSRSEEDQSDKRDAKNTGK